MNMNIGVLVGLLVLFATSHICLLELNCDIV